MALSGNTATAYTLTLTAVSGKGQEKDTGCTALRVDVAQGSPTYKLSTGSDTNRCWSK